MSLCQHCASENIAQVIAKCDDKFVWTTKDEDYEGYVKTPGGEFGPDSRDSGSDYLKFSYCLNCGTIQSSFPCATTFDEEFTGESGGSGGSGE